MRSIYKNIPVLLIMISLLSCQNQVFFNPFKIGHNLNTLEVPRYFDWTLDTNVDLGFEFELVGDSLESLEGQRLYLLDTNFRPLTRGIIHDSKTHLYYKVPYNMGVMYAYLPITGNFEYIYSTACLGTLRLRYGWEDPDEELGLQYLDIPFDANYFNSKKTSHALKASVFANSDFSDNSIEEAFSYTSNLNTDGKWYKSTMNKGPATIEEYNGNSALKLGQKSNRKVEVFQTVSWTESGEFTVSMQGISPSGKTLKIKLYLLFYSNYFMKLRQRTSSYSIKNANEWQTLEVSGDIPNNTSLIKIVIQDQKNNDVIWIDNVTTNYDTDNDNDDDGIPNDEDDYPDDADRAFNDYYPSSSGTSTLAFEDLWPSKGDYDFNDLVLDYRFNQVRNADNKVIEILAHISLRAIGGSFHNGFGFELPFNQSLIASVTGTEHQEGIVELRSNGTESGSDNAIIIVFEDAWNFLRVPGTSFVNTRTDAGQTDPYTFDINIQLTRGLSDSELVSPPYNPFIFVNAERDREIHLFGQSPTSKMDQSLFGTGDDYSDTASSQYFKTNSNLPWALNIPASFDYPEEKSSVDSAYNYFIEWAETGGLSKNDWYESKQGYRNTGKIYRRN